MVRKGKRIISLILVVALVFCMIPEEVYASDIILNEDSESIYHGEGDETRKLEQPVEEVGTGESNTVNTVGDYVIPQKWNGLTYALFTSSSNELALNNYKTFISGDIHSNKGFTYNGTELHINGKVDVVEYASILTSSMEGAQETGAVVENSNYIEMPDLTSELKSYLLQNATVYDTDKSYDADYIPLHSPVLSKVMLISMELHS